MCVNRPVQCISKCSIVKAEWHISQTGALSLHIGYECVTCVRQIYEACGWSSHPAEKDCTFSFFQPVSLSSEVCSPPRRPRTFAIDAWRKTRSVVIGSQDEEHWLCSILALIECFLLPYRLSPLPVKLTSIYNQTNATSTPQHISLSIWIKIPRIRGICRFLFCKLERQELLTELTSLPWPLLIN